MTQLSGQRLSSVSTAAAVVRSTNECVTLTPHSYLFSSLFAFEGPETNVTAARQVLICHVLASKYK